VRTARLVDDGLVNGRRQKHHRHPQRVLTALRATPWRTEHFLHVRHLPTTLQKPYSFHLGALDMHLASVSLSSWYPALNPSDVHASSFEKNISTTMMCAMSC
jgi:hypothetical protein